MNRLAAAIVAVAVMTSVVGSVGAPLITAVAIDTHVSLVSAQWTLTLTLLTGAISAPLLGRLGSDGHEYRYVVMALAAVTLGGLLTVVPAPFAVLLCGRAIQGCGLGVAPLLMTLARQHLATQSARTTIATVSVASTAGIGVGYPAVSAIATAYGLRWAYGLGLLLSLLAWLIAWRALPDSSNQRRHTPFDWMGIALFGSGTSGLLVGITVPGLWRIPAIATVVLVASTFLLAAFTWHERRIEHPLIDVRSLANPPVMLTQLAMLLAGISMYAMFTAFTRYVQTPHGAGYGYGLTGAAAGAALIPFSVAGFAAGRSAPTLSRRLGTSRSYLLAALLIFAAGVPLWFRDTPLLSILVGIAVLGVSVGLISAIMPTLVLAVTSKNQASSSLSVNQLARAVGMSAGSAMSGLLLQSATHPHATLPAASGYIVAAVAAVVPAGVSAAMVVAAHYRSAKTVLR